MFRRILQNELLSSNYKKQSIILSYFRFQSETHNPRSLPDNIPILKPLPRASSSAALRIKTISKAMKAYLERSRNYDDFLKVKTDEFEIGRQHLANMMGLDAASLTQKDIDKAIAYLFPSGLFEPKARPMMKPPGKLYPREKAAQFDSSGRPFSAFFYTRNSNYHEALHEIVDMFAELDAFEDSMMRKGILEPPPETALQLGGGDWLVIEDLQSMFLEVVSESDRDFLVAALTRLAQHPYAFRCKDLIFKFRKSFADLGMDVIPDLLYDEDGRPFSKATGKRLYCIAKVRVYGNGTGKICINGTDITFFERVHDREQLMFPLVFTELLGLVDIVVDLTGNGTSAQAGAIRHGLSLCLRSFVDKEMVDKMRLAGLLIRDKRHKGRKIYGQKGHRAKYKWLKR